MEVEIVKKAHNRAVRRLVASVGVAAAIMIAPSAQASDGSDTDDNSPSLIDIIIDALEDLLDPEPSPDPDDDDSW